MIIKVITPGIEDRDGHWLFGNVLRYNAFKYAKEGQTWKKHNIRMMHETDAAKKHYLLFHLHMDDESEYSVATDDVVYVMNDKGDTIQKLIA